MGARETAKRYTVKHGVFILGGLQWEGRANEYKKGKNVRRGMYTFDFGKYLGLFG